MPSYIDLEPALLRWQIKYNQSPTYAEVAQMAGISLGTLYRMMSGRMHIFDGRKIIPLCKALECEPEEILHYGR
jgi:DNA-binding Xre family transcriptional regulator